MVGVVCFLGFLSFCSVYLLVAGHAGDLEALLTAFSVVGLFGGVGYLADRITRRVLRR